VNPFRRAAEIYRSRGFLSMAQAGFRVILGWPFRFAGYCRSRWFRSRETFTWGGQSYLYFFHMHNTTWRNERSVEVPIVRALVSARPSDRVLEIGNVLRHYLPVRHDVVDKYEKAPGVINQDVVDYRPDKTYDLIVAISTLEHVGWDEEPQDPTKILRAIENLKACLAPGGKIVVTMPIGENPHLDRLLKEGRIAFSEKTCMKRVSRRNEWVEAPWEEVRELRYNSPFPNANGIIVGTLSP
jgi:hypothetical protein